MRIVLTAVLAVILSAAPSAAPSAAAAGAAEQSLAAALTAVARAERNELQAALNDLAVNHGNTRQAEQARIIRAGAVLTELIVETKSFKGCLAMQKMGVAFKGCYDEGFGFGPLELALALSDLVLGSRLTPALVEPPPAGGFWQDFAINLPAARAKEYEEVKHHMVQLEQGQIPQASLARITQVTRAYWLNRIMSMVQRGFVAGEMEQRALFYSVAISLMIEANQLDVDYDALYWFAPSARDRIDAAIDECLERIRKITASDTQNLRLRSVIESAELDVAGHRNR